MITAKNIDEAIAHYMAILKEKGITADKDMLKFTHQKFTSKENAEKFNPKFTRNKSDIYWIVEIDSRTYKHLSRFLVFIA